MTTTSTAEALVRTTGTTFDLEALRAAIHAFKQGGQLGADPVAALYASRRANWSLFTPGLRDAEIEALRPYLFPYDRLPSSPSDAPIVTRNFIAGQWQPAASGKQVTLNTLWDDRIPFASVPDSQAEDVGAAVGAAHAFWASLAWTEETVAYRKAVVSNLSRILEYYYEEVMAEIRHEIPKTRLEGDKDYWEAKRACDHIGGNADKAMLGEALPTHVSGHSYWKNPFVPAGVVALITPMNFIYGIAMIQLVGAYMANAPFVFKGHPYGAVSSTVMIRMMLAAGANPAALQKLEGFGSGIASLSVDPRVAVVSLTGSEETAKTIQAGRGIRTLRFEGGGCNWSWIDDGYSDEELLKIAERLTYSKLGFSSHKCTTLHGVSGSRATIDRLAPMIKAEMDRWEVANPAFHTGTKVVGPNMVHKARTVTNILEAARKAGAKVLREGGKVSGTDYADHAEVIDPVMLEVTPELTVTCDWDGKGEKTFALATTEFFMPILCVMEMPTFEDFLKFSLFTNSHDLAVSIWSRDDRKLQRGRQVLAGMLKENDGTDSALEWEEFGASGIGGSGNTGVGDAETTISMFCRRQKGRHLVF